MNSTRWQRTLAIGAISTLLMGGGFACIGGSDDEPDRLRRDDTAGGIPDRAKVVEEGKGEISYKAEDDGRLYLYDTENNTLRHTATVRRGDRYTASIEDDVVAINGERATKVSLSSEHEHKLYFLASDRISDRDTRDSRDRLDSRSGSGVPDTARMVGEGRSRELSFKANTDGTAYLYDATDDRLVETFRLRDGERLTISPDDNAISIEGKAVRGATLDRRTNYRLFFDKR